MPKKTSAEKLKKLVTKRNKTVQRIKKLKTKKTVPLRKVRTKIQEAKYKKTQKKINANPTAQANRAKSKAIPKASTAVRKKRMMDRTRTTMTKEQRQADLRAKMKERMNREMKERQNKEREKRKLERMKPTRMGATRNATSRRTIRRTR
jgi:hypothetical protein